MSWLNTPKAIVESIKDQNEEQFYGAITGVWRRWRKNTYTTTRYVGGTYAAAVAKKVELAGDENTEAEVNRAGEGGQYQCVVNVKTPGIWSAWELSAAEEE